MFYRWCRTVHNWLGLLLVIQILLWFISGLVMAILPIEQVRGEHLRSTAEPVWSQAQVTPATVLAGHSADAVLELSQRLTGTASIPVYQVHDQHHVSRYSALTGEPLQPLSATEITALAQAQYTGSGRLLEVQQLQQAPAEVRHLATPLWQARFADDTNTVFYLDTATGVVQRVRTDQWRLFDFLWMLHIMDYDERSNFNNPLLITTAALASLFTLTGMVLLWRRFRPGKKLK